MKPERWKELRRATFERGLAADEAVEHVRASGSARAALGPRPAVRAMRIADRPSENALADFRKKRDDPRLAWFTRCSGLEIGLSRHVRHAPRTPILQTCSVWSRCRRKPLPLHGEA